MTTKLAYSIAEAVTATGLSKTHLTDAIRARHLKAHKSSVNDATGEAQGKLLIFAADLQAYLETLPEAVA